MKRSFQHPPERLNGRKYWRSLEEQAASPEFREWLDREFPAGAAEMEADGVSRRNFLQLMGASIALAGFGMTGCRRPEGYLKPYSNSIEWVIPGKPLLYATAMPRRRGAMPLVVTTHEGRPTKIEGNPLHPASNGGTDVFAQISILDLYDPDRARPIRLDGQASTADALVAELAKLSQEIAADRGASFAVLAEENSSPTRARLRAELERRCPRLTWAEYEPLRGADEAAADAAAFGRRMRVRHRFAAADVVVSVGSDFLGCDEGGVEASRDFAGRRKDPSQGMNRLYVAEHRYTVTGGMADHRCRLRAGHLPAFTVALAKAVAAEIGNADLASFADGVRIEGTDPALDAAWIRGAAGDLASAKGRSLVVAGALLPGPVRLLVHAINGALGNVGRTLELVPSEALPAASIADLAARITSGGVKHLLLLGGNPAFNAPADLKWADLQKSVPNVIRLSLHEDESCAGARWKVPAAHYLESWGDALSADGTYLPVQPMIEPLHGGVSELQVLAVLAGLKFSTGPGLVRETFAARTGGTMDETKWTAFLRDGLLRDSAAKPVPTAFNGGAARAALGMLPPVPAPAADDAFEVVFVGDSKVDDGRYANNGWAQELPDPITRLTWDNAALVSPATAQKLGIQLDKRASGRTDTARIVRIEAGGAALELPVLVSPGHADHSITVALGYGRRTVGRVGAGVGFDAYPLRSAAAAFVASVAQVELLPESRVHKVAVTHGHWNMEGRDLFREGTLEEYQENPAFAKTMGMDGHIPPNVSLYKTPTLDMPEQWGMAIDLTVCTGCSACVVACQAENNIPIVGKEQVINQREMHWMRIDRYFASADPSTPDPEMVMQPVACMHCENAPCETVCPVNATVHSGDGMNVMVYNRCIGTRYCANNCPYKVRRFNYFDYNKRDVLGKWKPPVLGERSNLYKGPLGPLGMQTEETLKLQKNPNVTVRMRGVMEKCTFCVQRIESERITTRVKAGHSSDPAANLRMPTDAVKTACQQACPSEAIVFGDLRDPEGRVAKAKNNPRDYRMLEYLNVLPRLSYLARVRNPNPAMPDAATKGRINAKAHAAPGDSHGGQGEQGANGDHGNPGGPKADGPRGGGEKH